MRPVILDLFCGAGGAAVGYHRAGFDVVGIDHKPQPNYPYTFIEADAVEELSRLDVTFYAAIHASPPCQRYMTGGTHRTDHPDLVGRVRKLLQATGIPWVIENVPGAPMRADVTLCGSMFGLAVRRHRVFEFSTPQAFAMPPCDHSKPIVGVYGNAHGKAGAWPGMLPGNRDTWSRGLGVDWMEPRELSQAIPPAYTEVIGKRLLEVI